jgi:hypothetical protein
MSVFAVNNVATIKHQIRVQAFHLSNIFFDKRNRYTRMNMKIGNKSERNIILFLCD